MSEYVVSMRVLSRRMWCRSSGSHSGQVVGSADTASAWGAEVSPAATPRDLTWAGSVCSVPFGEPRCPPH